MNKKTVWIILALIPLGIFGCGPKRIVDNINLPFVNDPDVIGEWTSVDFVTEPSLFSVGKKRFGGDLYLKRLIFLPEGKLNDSWQTWTKGIVMHSEEKTASAYIIKDSGGAKYMFFEWKSGDYVLRHQKPQYYVLKKT